VSTSTSIAVQRQAIRKIALPASTILALLFGIIVYALDRDWATTLFLAPVAAYQPAKIGLFGPLGYVLPSFLHAYAFSLLLIIALGRTGSARWIGATTWFVFAASLEITQADFFRRLFIDLTSRSTGSATITIFHSYIANGHFDPFDLAAAGIGCSAAFAIASVLEVAK
jgi:hypothetical protein